MSTRKKCIYCDEVNPAWAKAHVVPRLMGTFKNQLTLLGKVCAECDSEIGDDCESLLAKCTIEAILIKHIGIIGRHKDKSTSPFHRGNLGYPPIRMTVALSGYENELRVAPVGDSKNVNILPQLILIDEQGNREEIVISNPDCISLTEWRMLLKKCIEGGVESLDAKGISGEQFHLIKHIFNEVGITYDLAEDVEISPTETQILVKGQITYDNRYFRAIAKIALHYFLVHSKIFNGFEEEFYKIRRFVRYGEGKEQDFIEKYSEPIAHDPSGNDRPPYYGHVLRTEIKPNSIAVCVQLFIGHDYKPEWYRVLLSQKQRNIFLQSEEFGHYYRYLEPDKRSDYDGVIESLTVAQIINIPGQQKP